MSDLFPLIDPAAHVDWAERVGAKIAAHYRFRRRSAGWEDIRSVAVLTMVAKSKGFDPARVPPGGDFDGAFRGWAHPSVRGECVREARRQRNGGTFHTSKELEKAGAEQIEVLPLPEGRDDEPAPLPDRRPAPEPADPDPLLLEFAAVPPPPTPEGVPLPALDAEIAAKQAELATYTELRRHLTSLFTLVIPNPHLAAVVRTELSAVLVTDRKERRN